MAVTIATGQNDSATGHLVKRSLDPVKVKIVKHLR
jgi:hypothetical protein